MVRFSKFIAALTDEVCRADYLSLRLQEKYITDMASHRAPVPGEGYLRYMAADEIDVTIHLKQGSFTLLQKIINWLLRRKEKKIYHLCAEGVAEVSLKVVFRRPASSPLAGQKNQLSVMYEKGQPLEKDWETSVYVAD